MPLPISIVLIGYVPHRTHLSVFAKKVAILLEGANYILKGSNVSCQATYLLHDGHSKQRREYLWQEEEQKVASLHLALRENAYVPPRLS